MVVLKVMAPNRVLAMIDLQKAFTNVQNMSTVEMLEKNSGKTCLRLRVYCNTCITTNNPQSERIFTHARLSVHRR